jgi:hypothetical protein
MIEKVVCGTVWHMDPGVVVVGYRIGREVVVGVEHMDWAREIERDRIVDHMDWNMD